ncbi:hypothetical protein GCM10010885_07060 [Alicyclobacillus cellulosilyticus]|uniref:Rhamnogalacturonan endolyase n=1 Tax=Alicyclobacillus cellulosilyticus TaxID=1003997 RepID=A0A917K651_9BACL|nr:cadherin-like beta sandwich domain-containing protein [Alicyclobacillus cellulosilyticus]GGJ00409.1 hypothetical protein GCM10010885_07060 [Alicyclobacillus cellulosilyticus]
MKRSYHSVKRRQPRAKAVRLSSAVFLSATLAVLPGINGFARADSSDQVPDMHLAGLTLIGLTSAGTAVPLQTDQPFTPSDVGYTITVPSEIQSIEAVPSVADPNAVSIVVNGTMVQNGHASTPISLVQGQTNTFGVSVVSKAPFASHSYVFTAYREKATEHLLHSLSIQGGTLGTEFAPRTLSYSTSVDYNQTSIRVTAAPVSPSDTVTVNGIPVAADGSATVPLQEGNNSIHVTVSSADPSQGSTTYTLSVYRATHDELQNLTTNTGVAIRPFTPTNRTYEVDVAKDTTQIQLTPTAFASDASITVNGQSIQSGQPSQSLPLKPGMNTFDVNVNGKTDYTVAVYRDPGDGHVHVIDNGSTVTIRTREIVATFDKSSSVLTELHKPGDRDVLGKGYGYFFLNPTYQDATTGKFTTLNWSPGTGDASFHIASQSDDMVDIYFTFDNNTPNDSPTRKGPIAYELHFVFRNDQPGFYVYITAHMPENEASLTPGMLNWDTGQVRWSIRADAQLFKYVQNEGQAPDMLPSPEQVTSRYQVMDATFRQPDGSAYTKYQDVVSEAYQHVFGLLGQHYGLWFIKGGNDYTNGLPNAIEIGAHQTDTTPIVNWAPSAAHYGRNVGQPAPGWSHIWGPIFVYLNEGHDLSAIYRDAEDQARAQISQWPYAWLTNPLYAVDDRGTVSGKLTITGHVPSGGATVILAPPNTNTASLPDPNVVVDPNKDWQQEALGYVYYTRTDASGHFTLRHVRAGTYTLWAYQTGTWQEYEYDGVLVLPNQETDLGNLVWNLKPEGHLLWQIGKFDRTAAEFRYGSQYRHWGNWLRYPFDFPNGVNYYVGQSDPSTDWNYVQPLNKTPGEPYNLLTVFSNDPAIWNVHFKVAEVPKDSKGVLTVAIAGQRSPDIKFVLNGTQLDEYSTSLSDSTMPRVGIQGNLYTVLQIPFDSSLLHPGSDNVLSLIPGRSLLNAQGQRVTDYYSSILYDALRMDLVPVQK